MDAASPQVAGGPPLGGRARGLGEHATATQHRHLVGSDRVVFGVAPMDRFHREGMSHDDGKAFVGTEIGQPIPSEETLDRHHQAVTLGRDGREKWCWAGGHVAVQHDLPILLEDADLHGAGMPVDATVQLVLRGVESPEVSSSS
jgi:hypothetical protein